MTIALVTDSTASLSEEVVRANNIDVVALQVIIGAESFEEGVNVSADAVSKALAEYIPVNTSRPTPERFVRAYREAAEAGASEVVSVHLSSKISGTFDSALLAAKQSPIPVTCVDTSQVGIAVGFSTLRAAAVRADGGSVKAVAEAARQAGQNSFTVFYVDTLEYLRRGGRVGAAAALLGAALAVKPLLTVSGGLITQLEKVRTSAKALARLETLLVERAGSFGNGFDVGIQHLANPTVAAGVATRLTKSLGIETVAISEVGASIGAHVGPGMIAATLTPHA